MTTLNALKSKLSSSLRINLIFSFFIICCVAVVFQVSLFAQTGDIFSDDYINKTNGMNLNLVRTPEIEQTNLVSNRKTKSDVNRFQNAVQFYVAPNGSSSGDGSIGNPWDLKTAFSHPSAIQPGAIVWLRGGVYNIPQGLTGFINVLTGTPNEPIRVMSYPGEWAVVDGNLSNSSFKNNTIITNQGDYIWFINFEITNTETSNRKIDTPSSNPPERRGSAIYDYGTGTKIINLVIHDAGQGIGAWQQGRDNEYYGNVIYNNGWDAPDRGHGHGTYTQNNNGLKTFEDNLFFNAFGQNTRMGGTGAASARGYNWVGNVFFNGTMAWDGPNIENLKVIGNYTYNQYFQLGQQISSTSRDAEVRDNYFMSGVQLYEFTQNVTFVNNTIWNNNPAGKNLYMDIQSWNPTKFTIDNNVYYKAYQSYPYWHFKVNYQGSSGQNYNGFYAFDQTSGSQQTTYAYTQRSWQDDLQIDQNSRYIDSPLTKTRVFVKPNKYDSERSNIVIYNWGQLDTVFINAKSILRPGDRYVLRNVQDYFGDVVTGIYRGGWLGIRMNGRTRAKPIGYDQTSGWYHDPLQPNTFPTFGVFVLTKTN